MPAMQKLLQDCVAEWGRNGSCGGSAAAAVLRRAACDGSDGSGVVDILVNETSFDKAGLMAELQSVSRQEFGALATAAPCGSQHPAARQQQVGSMCLTLALAVGLILVEWHARRPAGAHKHVRRRVVRGLKPVTQSWSCLLYTSDAADE